jgi:predicted nucleic acid-binding protein
VQSIREVALVTSSTRTVEFPELEKRDSTDLVFLTAAVEGDASYIVTQDLDLLDIKLFQGISIIDPLAFLIILRSS